MNQSWNYIDQNEHFKNLGTKIKKKTKIQRPKWYLNLSLFYSHTLALSAFGHRLSVEALLWEGAQVKSMGAK